MKKMSLLGVGFVASMLLVGCSNNTTQPSNTQQTTTQSSSSSSSQTGSSSNTTTTTTTNVADIKISVADAIKFYQEKHPNSDITGIDIEKSLGKYVYDIEGMDDNTEYKLKFDAATKDVLEDRSEMLDADEQNGVERNYEKLDLTNLIDLNQATQAAQNEVTDGQVESWSIDKENNMTYWEVNFRVNHQEVSVKLNGQSGAILEKEVDD